MNEIITPTPEIENESKGPSIAEIVDFAWKEGLIDTDVRNDWMDIDSKDTILAKIRGAINQQGQDTDEVFARWGIVAEAEES